MTDKEIIRSLAHKIKDISLSVENEKKKKKWLGNNSLTPVVPSIVMCDPENGWNEIITEDKLECTGELRGLEFHFRRLIFQSEEIQDDTVITSDFNVPFAGEYTDWGLNEQQIKPEGQGAYTWIPPITNYDTDLEKLNTPTFIFNKKESDKNLNYYNDLLGDILDVRFRQQFWWSLGLTKEVILMRGIENFMMDMLDQPENLHNLMNILSKSKKDFVKSLESQGVLCLNNQNDYVGSGAFGWTNELPSKNFSEKVSPKDMWLLSESQETVSVSPNMFEEFVFPYQKNIADEFGLLCYGCCEPLDKRWHIIKQFKNLRRVSVSAWANIENMAENLQNNYIFSWKPNPSLIAMESFDENLIKSYISDMLEKTKGCIREITLKDCHTIRKDPERVKKFCKIAKECIENQV